MTYHNSTGIRVSAVIVWDEVRFVAGRKVDSELCFCFVPTV